MPSTLDAHFYKSRLSGTKYRVRQRLLNINYDPILDTPTDAESESEFVKVSALAEISGPPNLETLPGELHLRIFDYLVDDPVTSICLGLTCRKLYPMHRAQHKIVHLWQRSVIAKRRRRFRLPDLSVLLHDTLLKGYVWDNYINKCITLERSKELEAFTRDEERRELLRFEEHGETWMTKEERVMFMNFDSSWMTYNQRRRLIEDN